MNPESLLLFVVAPVSGLVLGLLLGKPAVLSGKMALGLSLLPFVGLLLARVFCWGHSLESLGPGVMLGGLPLSGVYSGRAVRRAPDRPWAWSGLTLSLLAISGLAVLLLLAAFGG